jgi:hypothetical protein
MGPNSWHRAAPRCHRWGRAAPPRAREMGGLPSRGLCWAGRRRVLRWAAAGRPGGQRHARAPGRPGPHAAAAPACARRPPAAPARCLPSCARLAAKDAAAGRQLPGPPPLRPTAMATATHPSPDTDTDPAVATAEPGTQHPTPSHPTPTPSPPGRPRARVPDGEGLRGRQHQGQQPGGVGQRHLPGLLHHRPVQHLDLRRLRQHAARVRPGQLRSHGATILEQPGARAGRRRWLQRRSSWRGARSALCGGCVCGVLVAICQGGWACAAWPSRAAAPPRHLLPGHSPR